MTVVFTICSNNYLAQAKTLMDSVHQHNPEYSLVICLADKKREGLDYTFFEPAKILTVEEVLLNDLESLIEGYDIVEFNTAIKPSLFKHLINRGDSVENIYYLDPDIKLYTSLEHLNKKLVENSILLTPHINTPIELDNKSPTEQTFQNHGIFNLGFLGLKADSMEVKRLLNWWEERCLKLCIKNVKEGLFVDQLWMNFVPVYFKEVYIIREYGYNMAPWNLHERKILESSDSNYILNDSSELVFYHFSSYDFNNPGQLNKPFYNRFDLKERKDLCELYRGYYEDLINNRIEEFSSIDFAFLRKQEDVEEKQKNPLHKKVLKSIVPPIIYNNLSNLKRVIYA